MPPAQLPRARPSTSRSNPARTGASAGRPAPICWSTPGLARVVAALTDPDSRTAGAGFARLRAAGIAVTIGIGAEEAASRDGRVPDAPRARPPAGDAQARAVARRPDRAALGREPLDHRPASARPHPSRTRARRCNPGRARHASTPTRRVSTCACPGWRRAARAACCSATAPPPRDGRRSTQPAAIASLDAVDHLFVEGGAGAASAFLAADLVDRLLLYRAPILIGEGRPAIGDIGLAHLRRRA